MNPQKTAQLLDTFTQSAFAETDAQGTPLILTAGDRDAVVARQTLQLLATLVQINELARLRGVMSGVLSSLNTKVNGEDVSAAEIGMGQVSHGAQLLDQIEALRGAVDALGVLVGEFKPAEPEPAVVDAAPAEEEA